MNISTNPNPASPVGKNQRNYFDTWHLLIPPSARSFFSKLMPHDENPGSIFVQSGLNHLFSLFGTQTTLTELSTTNTPQPKPRLKNQHSQGSSVQNINATASLDAVYRAMGMSEVSAKLNAEQFDDWGPMLLRTASGRGDTVLVSALLAANLNPNASDKEGYTPLLYAADPEDPHPDVVSLLLEAGADPNHQAHSDCSTALINVSRFPFKPVFQLEVVNLLINNGADLNLKNDDDLTALLCAVWELSNDVALRLIEAGAEVNHISDEHGASAFSQACLLGEAILCEALSEAGADINWRNGNGETALLVTARVRTDYVIEFIIAGADFNLTDRKGRSPLFIAASKGDTNSVNLMVTRTETIIDQTDHTGRSPLMIAANEGHADTAAALLNRGANPNLIDHTGCGLLVHACNGGLTNLVTELLVGGADPNLQDDSGRTPLMIAANLGHIDLVTELLAGGADPNLQDDAGRTPLMAAASLGHTAIAKELLTSDARLDLTNNRNETALMIATEAEQLDSAFVLLKADPGVLCVVA